MGSSRWSDRLARPLLADLVRQRSLGLITVAAAFAQVAITLAGIPGLGCPWHELTGTPCPGCGMSRACAALVRGDWPLGLRLHPFAPLALVALAAIGLGIVLPGRPRARFVDALATVERRTFAAPVVGVLLVAYALARIALGINPDDLWRPPA